MQGNIVYDWRYTGIWLVESTFIGFQQDQRVDPYYGGIVGESIPKDLSAGTTSSLS